MDDPKVNLKLVHLDGESLVTGVVTTVVDTSVEECAANEFCSLYSRKFKRSARDRGITDFTVKCINDHSLYYLTTRNLGVLIPGFAEREFRLKATWKKDDLGNALVYFEDTSECDITHPVKSKSVVTSVQTFWFFEPLPSIGGVPQTKVTLTSKVNLRGAIPSRIMNALAPRFASTVSDLRKKFDRNRSIDTANSFDKYNESHDFKLLKSPDSRVVMKAVHLDGESLVTGIATAMLDASAEDCAAYEFCIDSREMDRTARDRGITDKTVKHINDHRLYYLSTRTLGVPGFALRQGRNKAIWHKDDHGRILIDFSDTLDCDESHPVRPHVIVASVHTVWSFEPLPPIGDIPQTKVNFIAKIDFKGAIPSRMMNR